MRYYLKKCKAPGSGDESDTEALIIRGDFRAAGNCVDGGIKDIKTILNISVPRTFSDNASDYINKISTKLGFLQPHFGLLTAVPITNTCIASYDYITAFVTAAVSDTNRTVNITVTSKRKLTDSALLGALMTLTEAKMKVLASRNIPAGALSTDASVVAFEKTESNEPAEEFAGALTPTGEKIYKAVYWALTQALARFDNYLLNNWGVSRGWSKDIAVGNKNRPSFFIYSRYGGDHWNEWIPEGCAYYPCHNYPNQKCYFCYCPLYPCEDTELGEFIDTQNGKVWSCMDCVLIHEPKVANHLLRNPEAGISELKKVRSLEC